MMDYGDEIVSSIMLSHEISHTLGQIASKPDLLLRIAEPKISPCHLLYERWSETKFEGEDRLLIPSPQVDTL